MLKLLFKLFGKVTLDLSQSVCFNRIHNLVNISDKIVRGIDKQIIHLGYNVSDGFFSTIVIITVS